MVDRQDNYLIQQEELNGIVCGHPKLSHLKKICNKHSIYDQAWPCYLNLHRSSQVEVTAYHGEKKTYQKTEDNPHS